MLLTEVPQWLLISKKPRRKAKVFYSLRACMHAKSLQSCLTLRPHGLQPA